MSDSVKDMLASVTADMDQAQATINEARVKYPNDVAFQKHLDHQQMLLDLQRDRAKLMKFIDDTLDKID